MQEQQDFLGTEPVGRLLFRLAVPAVTAQLVNMLYNIVDRIYIGHIPDVGDLALTGVGICLPVILLVSAFAALVSMGGAPRASIAMGAGDMEQAERILGNCFTLQLILSAALTVVLLVFRQPMLLAFGASENTIGYASDYLSIYALGTAFAQITLGMNAFINAQGFASVGMKTVLIGAVCNIVLDPVLIYGVGMGVRGAALATVLSQCVSMTWALSFLCGKKSRLRLSRALLGIDRRVLAPCLALGISPFIMQSTESVLSVCFNTSLLRYGDDIAVGAMTILSSVMQLATLPMQGIAQGAQPITSYNFGAGRMDRVRSAFFLLLGVSVAYAAALWLAVELVPQAFAAIFTSNLRLIAFTRKALRIYCGALVLMGAQVACQMTFVALGNAKASAFLAILRKCILLIPLIYLLPHLMSDRTMAVYTAEPVADCISVTVTVAMFAAVYRRELFTRKKKEAH